jgi:hypothetical protein
MKSSIVLSMVLYYLKRFQSVFRAFSERFQNAFKNTLKSKKVPYKFHLDVLKSVREHLLLLKKIFIGGTIGDPAMQKG